jgi:RNA polymerase sigma-70 factor (ECF subfamily)
VPDPDAESDDSLIAASAGGDEAAFNRLVRRHADRAHALAARFAGSASDADDIVQEAFWRAWRAAPRWRAGEAAFSTWLHRVVLNLCIDRERRGKLRRWLALDAVPEPAQEEVAVDDRLMASAELRAVSADLRTLPPRQRAAIMLAAGGERSNAEIAASLGVSEKAVESLLVRARRTLRARYREREGMTS